MDRWMQEVHLRWGRGETPTAGHPVLSRRGPHAHPCQPGRAVWGLQPPILKAFAEPASEGVFSSMPGRS